MHRVSQREKRGQFSVGLCVNSVTSASLFSADTESAENSRRFTEGKVGIILCGSLCKLCELCVPVLGNKKERGAFAIPALESSVCSLVLPRHHRSLRAEWRRVGKIKIKVAPIRKPTQRIAWVFDKRSLTSNRIARLGSGMKLQGLVRVCRFHRFFMVYNKIIDKYKIA